MSGHNCTVEFKLDFDVLFLQVTTPSAGSLYCRYSLLYSIVSVRHVDMNYTVCTAFLAPVIRFPQTRHLRAAHLSRNRKQSIHATARRARHELDKHCGTKMKVAVVGCVHGELDTMYAAVREIEEQTSSSVDLIVCAGDFQAVRNDADLTCMACPEHYRDMRSFWKYYSGEAVATVPTIFVGGNHEASNHLQEIPLGGLVAPNMYFLGNAGIVNYRGLRIGGISGVYVQHNYEKTRSERPPYQHNQIKSVYHARKEDVDRMLRVQQPLDIFLSHDWPRGIWKHGNLDNLLKAKPYFRAEISRNDFGSPGTALVLDHIKPKYWFSAHCHVKFPALVSHPGSENKTRFLALDKALRKRDFIQLVDIPVSKSPGLNENEDAPLLGSGEYRIQFDPEWLTILRSEGKEPGRVSPVHELEMEQTMGLLKNHNILPYINPLSNFEQYAKAHDPTLKQENPISTSFQMQPSTIKLFQALELSPDKFFPQFPYRSLSSPAVPANGILPETSK